MVLVLLLLQHRTQFQINLGIPEESEQNIQLDQHGMYAR